MDDDNLVTVLRILALHRDAQRSRPAIADQGANGITPTDGPQWWIGVLGAICDSDDADITSGAPSSKQPAELRQLLDEWQCFARAFVRFLRDLAKQSSDPLDGSGGVHGFDYKYGLSLLRRLSRMVLDAHGISTDPTDSRRFSPAGETCHDNEDPDCR